MCFSSYRGVVKNKIETLVAYSLQYLFEKKIIFYQKTSADISIAVVITLKILTK